MRRVIPLALAALALFATHPAHAQSSRAPIDWGPILIYQAEILEYVMPDEAQLHLYIDRLQAAAEARAQNASLHAAGVLFVALAPDGRSRVWLLQTRGVVLPHVREQWEQALSAVPGMSVRRHFLFGLTFGAGDFPAFESDGVPPIPPEWQAQIPPEGAMLDDAFIGAVWPASSR